MSKLLFYLIILSRSLYTFKISLPDIQNNQTNELDVQFFQAMQLFLLIYQYRLVDSASSDLRLLPNDSYTHAFICESKEKKKVTALIEKNTSTFSWRSLCRRQLVETGDLIPK